ncbi:hypothetical protein V3C99_011893, partial [Haemonchus contortus]
PEQIADMEWNAADCFCHRRRRQRCVFAMSRERMPTATNNSFDANFSCNKANSGYTSGLDALQVAERRLCAKGSLALDERWTIRKKSG